MRVRRIASFLLILYVAICAFFFFHTHSTERAGSHCNICQVLHAPGYPLVIAAHIPVFVLQESCLPIVQLTACSQRISPESQRAPPSI
jgi:hypothetical protein